MKKQIYFLLLILLLIIGVFQISQFEYNPQKNVWDFILQIWYFLLFIILFWSKKEFVGKGWFEKQQQKASLTETSSNENSNKTWKGKLPESSKTERNAYIALTKLCCSNDNQQKLIPSFEKLKDFSNDEEYMTLNYVMEYCDEQEIFFLMALDWKQDIETLEWRLETALQQNFDLIVEFPTPSSYGERASVSYDNVFEDYDKPLRKNGLQMGFIDTESDEYVIFIHRCDDKEKIITCVNKIGYKYEERN